MRAGSADRAMDQSPLAADTMRKQGSIFIFRRHDHPIALEVLEIFGERKRYAGSDTRVGGINDAILA